MPLRVVPSSKGPKTGESNRGQRITAPREKLQGPGGQAHWKGADQGLDVGMDELKTKLWGQSYRVPGLLKLYLQEAPLATETPILWLPDAKN